MGKEIIINAEKEQTRIAILEDGRLVELYFESPENERTLGDIVVGRVRKVMPSIRAAFLDIGQKQDAFLHFSDLSDNLPEILAYIDEDVPEVGKHAHHGDAPKSKGRRRRPKRKNDDDDDKDGGKRSRPDPKSRGRRRSAQRRARSGGRRQKDGGGRKSLDSHLDRGQRVLVKITKEPFATKGSRVSTDISLAGRFLVLVPLADYIAVSKKIVSYRERRRLKTLAKSLTPDGFGVIVRTVAEGKNAKALDTDLRLLVEKWRKIEKKLAGRPNPPLTVHEDVNMVSSVLRDLFSDDYDRIVVDENKVYRNVKSYVQAVAPHMVPGVQLHQAKQNIFEATGIAKDVKEAFESRVNLPSGGYLFIEKTEAMYVVDVNSGRSGKGLTQEQNSLRVNLEAARVITRQVRLRDIGGIIVVDFIDLRDDVNRKKVYDELKKEFKKDRAVTKLLPMSDFGLIQITRQRLRPSITTTYAGPDGTRSADAGAPADKKGDVTDDAAKVRDAAQDARDARRNDDDDRGDGRGDEKQEKQDDDAQRGERGGRGRGGRGRSGRGRSGRGRSERSDDDRQDDRQDDRREDRSAAPAAPAVSPEALLERLEAWISAYKSGGGRRVVALRVHPFTAAYLHRGVPNLLARWFMKHLVRVRLEADEGTSPLTFAFVDPLTGDELPDPEAAAESTAEATSEESNAETATS